MYSSKGVDDKGINGSQEKQDDINADVDDCINMGVGDATASCSALAKKESEEIDLV